MDSHARTIESGPRVHRSLSLGAICLPSPVRPGWPCATAQCPSLGVATHTTQLDFGIGSGYSVYKGGY
jgi:hypothetical protein